MSRLRTFTATDSILPLAGDRHVELVEIVGKGSFAKVYRAVLEAPHGIRRQVAVKLFSVVASDEADHVFAQIAEMTRRVAAVDHPNVVRVYECGTWRRQVFTVAELVDGVSLASLQEIYAAHRRRLPTDLALFVGCEVAEALAAARLALGLVHGNISAQEVLLSWRGEVKVADFESSMVRGATSSVRSLRGVASRATTMAPEIAAGGEGDTRSDVFSLGILLRELMIGPRFPDGLSNADAIALARDGYVQPMTFQPHLPGALVAILERALQVDPDERYPDACALLYDLRRVALAMGVGDGRYFLQRTLEREWSEGSEDVTTEHMITDLLPSPSAPHDEGSIWHYDAPPTRR